jgi:peptidylprolyl isomerase
MASGGAKRPRAFLDVDIDDRRAAYARACDFVAATNLRYGWTSPVLAELGGSERKRVLEFYGTDFEWAGRGRIALEPAAHERLVVELYPDAAPDAVKNFLALCAGDKGLAKGSGRPLHYKGVRVHRAIKGFMFQAGDFVMGNGTGGESIWGGTFKDEKGGLALKIDRRGVLAMGNSGKNSNGSQFFVTFGPRPALNGKHVVMGAVVGGWEVLDAIEAVAAEPKAAADAPVVSVVVADCGVLP